METNYLVVYNDPKKGEAAASALCEAMNNGAIIISATGTSNSIHYVIGYSPMDPANEMPPEDELQLAIDNLTPMNDEKNE
jgi:hypothetical protein